MKTEIDNEIIDDLLDAVRTEFLNAFDKFGKFNNAHEGYAVLLEELDELWDEIKNRQDKGYMFAEAKQVAAMAVRFMYDVCITDSNKQP